MRKINYLLMSVVAAHLFTESGVYATETDNITENLISNWSASDHAAFEAAHESDFAYFDKVFQLANGRLDMAKKLAAMDSNFIKLLGQNMDWLLDGVPSENISVRQDKLMRISKRPADIGLGAFVGTEFFSKLDNNAKKSEAFDAFRFSAKEMKKPVIFKGNYASVDDQLLASKEFGSGAKKAAFEKARADGLIEGMGSLEEVRAAVNFYKQKKNQTEAAKLASVVAASGSSWDMMPWAARQELIKKVDDAQKMVADIREAEAAVIAENANKEEAERTSIDAVPDLRLIDYILGCTSISPISQSNVALIINDVKLHDISAPMFVPDVLKNEWKASNAGERRAMNEFFAANPSDRNSVYSFAIEKGIIDPLFKAENNVVVDDLITALRAVDKTANIMNAVPKYLFDHLADSASAEDKRLVVMRYLAIPTAVGAISNKAIVDLSIQNAWISESDKYTSHTQFFDFMTGKYTTYMSELAEASSWQHVWIETNASGLTSDQKAKVRLKLGDHNASDFKDIAVDSIISDALWQDKALWAAWKIKGAAADRHIMEWLSTLANAPVGDMDSVFVQYTAYRQENPVILSGKEILMGTLNVANEEDLVSAASALSTNEIVSYFVSSIDVGASNPITFNQAHVDLFNEGIATGRVLPSTTPAQIVSVLEDLALDKANLVEALPEAGEIMEPVAKVLLAIGMTDGDILPFENGILPEKALGQADDAYVQDLAKFFVLRSIDAFEDDAERGAMHVAEKARKLYELKDLFSFDISNKDHRAGYIKDVFDMHQALMGMPTEAGGMPYSYLMSNLSNAQKGLIIKYLLDSGFRAADIKAPNSGDVAGMVPSLLERATFIALRSIGALDGAGLEGSDVASMMSYFRDELYRLRGIKDTFIFSVAENASYPKAQRIELLEGILAIEETIPASFYEKGDGTVFEKSALIAAMRMMTLEKILEAVQLIGNDSIPAHDTASGRAVYINNLVTPPASDGAAGSTGDNTAIGDGNIGAVGGGGSISGNDGVSGGGGGIIGGMTAFGGDDGFGGVPTLPNDPQS